MDDAAIIRMVSRVGGRVSEPLSEMASDNGMMIVSTNEIGGISVNGSWNSSFDSIDDLYVMSDGSISQNPDHEHIMIISPVENSGAGPEIVFDVVGMWPHRSFRFDSRDGSTQSGIIVLMPHDGKEAAA